MEDNYQWEEVIVTHIVNPYGMWSAQLSDLPVGQNTVARVNEILDARYKMLMNDPKAEDPKYEAGQFIGVYHRALKLWARAVIDDMFGEKSMLVWLIDLGFHLSKITLPDLIIPLDPGIMDVGPALVNKFGLYGVIPVQLVPDLLFANFELKPCKFWFPSALKVVEDYLQKATKTKFLRKREMILADGTKQVFGRFLFTLDDQDHDLAELLTKAKLAIYDEEQFLQALPKTKSVLSIDRIVPHSSRELEMENIERHLDEITRNQYSHHEYVLNWTQMATKIVKKKWLSPVEDCIESL